MTPPTAEQQARGRYVTRGGSATCRRLVSRRPWSSSFNSKRPFRISSHFLGSRVPCRRLQSWPARNQTPGMLSERTHTLTRTHHNMWASEHPHARMLAISFFFFRNGRQGIVRTLCLPHSTPDPSVHAKVCWTLKDKEIKHSSSVLLQEEEDKQKVEQTKQTKKHSLSE